jgi:RimJ/RimL family protein N-acetyltransferase
MWKNYLEERETKRLLIRPLVENDYHDWQEFIMDEIATKFFPDDWKLRPEKSIEWIDFQLKRYKENRYGLHALIEKKSGRLIGQCGLLTQNVDGRNELEIGYHLIPRYWGNGYAIEAAREFSKMCFENNLAESIISIIDIDNILSQKVAQRNGMTIETQTVFMEMNVFIYRIKREDYVKTAPSKSKRCTTK